MLDLGIVIVNFNTRDLLRQCLKSVLKSQGDLNFEICVVDNASSDGSAEVVAAEFPQVRLIRSPVNGGYSYANNQGLRAFGFEGPGGAAQTPEARHALLLNPDTLVPPTSLATLLAFMDVHPQAGVVGPKLLLMDGSLDRACRRSFPTPEVAFWRLTGMSKLFPRSRRFGRYNLTYLDPDETAEVDSVVGACMLVRAEAIAQAGLLDEGFFMYGEDLDWAKRIKEAGWRVYYHPEAVVHHVKRAASRHSAKAQIAFYRAFRIFYQKHYAENTSFWLHWPILLSISLLEGWQRLRQRFK